MELEGVRGLDRLVIERGLARGVLSPSAVAAAARRGGRLVDALVAAGAVAPAVMADLIAAVKADAEQTLVPASRPAAAAVDALGDYELLEKLGEGGMGAVWRARQRSLDRLVALKLIAGDQLEPEAVQRFVREARTAARLNHPHVVRVFDAGRAADGRVFMSLELVTAGDAKQLAAAAPGERLPEARALEVVRDACRGLVALSAAGLVHRDIKPANIFIAEDGRAKLADLGLARQARGDDRITTTGLVVGTPAFMAPEQADGGEVDVRADVYALGATLFALLCGRPPFEGATGVVVLCKVLNDPAPDPRTFVPGLTPRTVRLLQRALAKAPGARFQRADELLEALDEALAVVAQPGPARRASG
ncbi:MAG: serine/threonine protein kinase, partial [Planctomycetes bacterium]|nr:serine/threonine protein kinase [Planctomycetota bacterium]